MLYLKHNSCGGFGDYITALKQFVMDLEILNL